MEDHAAAAEDGPLAFVFNPDAPIFVPQSDDKCIPPRHVLGDGDISNSNEHNAANNLIQAQNHTLTMKCRGSLIITEKKIRASP